MQTEQEKQIEKVIDPTQVKRRAWVTPDFSQIELRKAESGAGHVFIDPSTSGI